MEEIFFFKGVSMKTGDLVFLVIENSNCGCEGIALGIDNEGLLLFFNPMLTAYSRPHALFSAKQIRTIVVIQAAEDAIPLQSGGEQPFGYREPVILRMEEKAIEGVIAAVFDGRVVIRQAGTGELRHCESIHLVRNHSVSAAT